jgi:transposase
VCGEEAKRHDVRGRTVRDLDSHRYQTFLEVRFPRVRCPAHGIVSMEPPFAAGSSRFSKTFETRIVQLCHEASTQKVAKDLGLNWHVVEGIKHRAFLRGKKARRRREVRHLAVDETSFRRHHNYSTIVTDADRGEVLVVLPSRDGEALEEWIKNQRVADFSQLKSVSMDMAPPYIMAIKNTFPRADQIICYDRFHVAQLFGRVVDAVRRRESAAYAKAEGDNPLVKTRWEWLRNSGRTDNRKAKRRRFLELARQPLLTAKAWKLKEEAAGLWEYVREGAARKAWEGLIRRLRRSRIGELKKLGKTVKKHLEGILNAIRLKSTNAIAEARNSCIQRVKCVACGYRDKKRFGREILFQFGGMDMSF